MLVLAGQTGWGMAETERALAAARHPERIVRTGYLPDEAVPALLRQAAVVAYPALEEGFGLPALEALACGAPLVTTEGTAMAEMAGGAALLVPPGDVAALADALGHGARGGPCDGPPVARASRSRRSGRGRRASRCTCRPMRWPGRPRSRVPRMRALITGGKGFVGQWLAAHLKDRGDEVAVIDIETDVADGAAVRRVMADVAPDAVYHLAAMTHVGESWENPSQVLRVNVLGTAEILAAARALAGSARVLVVSSAEVYGVVTPEQLPLGEDTPTAPASPYAASKLAAEAVALQAWRGYGQPVIVVRPFNHIGPGQSPNFFVPALAKRIVEARRVRGPVAAGRHADHPAGLHRRARRGGGLPAPDRAGCTRARSTTSARAATWPCPRSRRSSSSWPGPTSRSRPIPHWCGRSTCPCLRGDAERLRAATGWQPQHPARDNARRRPGLVGGGLTASVVGVRQRCRSGGADALADLGPDLAGLLARLVGQLGDRGGQLVLERLQGRLDELHGRLGQVVDLVDALGHALAHVVDALVEREVLGEPVLQLDPLHLGPLVAEHAEADGDVGRVAGEVGDALGEGGDVGGYVRHVEPPVWSVHSDVRGRRSRRQATAFVYKSITSVKQ